MSLLASLFAKIVLQTEGAGRLPRTVVKMSTFRAMRTATLREELCWKAIVICALVQDIRHAF
jgi:hypothetical protein